MTTGKKILLVDDDDGLRSSLSDQLRLHEEFLTAEAATAAARGEAERLAALVTPQRRSRTLPWLALASALLLALAAWLAASAAVAGVAALGGVGALLVAIHGLRQPMRLPQVSREQRDDILQQAQAAAREAGLKAAWVAGWEQGWAAGWKERD